MTTTRITGGTRARMRDERGSALVVALLSLLLLTALGLALTLTTQTETAISANQRMGQEAMNAADAAIERAMQDVLAMPDWNRALSGAEQSSFIDGSPGGSRALPDGTTVNLTEIANLARCGHASPCSAGEVATNSPERHWLSNNPVWQLFAYGPVSDLLPNGTVSSPIYVVVMIGDDPSETDGQPLVDGNAASNPGSGVLALRAEAFGPHGTHRIVEATIARTASTGLERGYVGQRGQDEQNRRARKSAVQTPGKALTAQQLTMTTGVVQ
jgi:Tfp pilus assembly protein PilX